eukprot:TRINITY_DN15486_c0_g1_i2.p1 TRINITY_DN15486_c0_g1~~TRINITY_DN15486_c0_g1_i2.p1  ORF type:complete len:176 (+),score=50.69 TRINITY_DN15486_c0_g1_i2:53-580(+)
MTRFWSDEVYGQFYQDSSAERGLVNKAQAKTSDFWEPSRKQVENFQGSFAEWSQGRGTLREADFRHFLLDIGVELTVAQARCLWQEVEPSPGTSRLDYNSALLAYCKVMEAPVQFKACKGAAPPGKRMEETPMRAEEPEASFGKDFSLMEKLPKQQDACLKPSLESSNEASLLLT